MERSSRYLLLHLPAGYPPTLVRAALIAKIATLDTVAAELSDRPRMTLDGDTPAECTTQLLNTTHQQQCCDDPRPLRAVFRQSRLSSRAAAVGRVRGRFRTS